MHRNLEGTCLELSRQKILYSRPGKSKDVYRNLEGTWCINSPIKGPIKDKDVYRNLESRGHLGPPRALPERSQAIRRRPNHKNNSFS